MKIDARSQEVRIAAANLTLYLIEFQTEKNLTDIEMIHILAESVEKLAWRMARKERGRLED